MCKTTISVTQLKSDKLHLRFGQENTIVLDLKATIDTKLGIQSSANSGHSGENRSTNQYLGPSRSPSHYQSGPLMSPSHYQSGPSRSPSYYQSGPPRSTSYYVSGSSRPSGNYHPGPPDKSSLNPNQGPCPPRTYLSTHPPAGSLLFSGICSTFISTPSGFNSPNKV